MKIRLKVISIILATLLCQVFYCNSFLDLLDSLIGLKPGCQCGLEKISLKVVDGELVLEARYPGYAHIMDPSYTDIVSVHGCGGAVITDKHVMTSAQCVSPLNKKKHHLKVYLEGNTAQDFKNTNEIYREVSNVFVHPLFKPKSKETGNDIAILELKKKIKFEKENISPVCLPDFDFYDNLFSCGRGDQNFNGERIQEEFLHRFKLKEIPNEVCQKYYKNHLINTTLSICTISKNGVCHGDDGIPLSTRKDGRVYAVGVASLYDSDCSVEEDILPNVFERVLPHLYWIKQITRNGTYCLGDHHPFTQPEITIQDMDNRFISMLV